MCTAAALSGRCRRTAFNCGRATACVGFSGTGKRSSSAERATRSRAARRCSVSQGFGLWGAREAGAPALCGFGGLWPFREPPELELLYGWTNGGGETIWPPKSLRSSSPYGFDALGMLSVRASTDAGNVASIRVLERLGFTFVRRGVAAGLDTAFYELPRPPARTTDPALTTW